MINQTISHYKILEKLGEGGMGVVYKAQDLKLDRLVALKFLPEHLTADEVEKERFIHEAKAASALSHPNVVVIHEIDEYDGKMYIVMEYCQGETLKLLIEKEALSLENVLEIGIQVCEGLTAAHEKGVIHRDIKPDNVKVTPKGRVKIMDFGLAKLKGAAKLTSTGSTLGTVAYMSPEQAQGMEVNHRSDLFCFGVVFYEMITGRLPFEGGHEAAIIYSIVNETPEPLARYKANVPEGLQRIVDKALDKDLSTRYQSAADIMVDLKRLQRERKAGGLLMAQEKRKSYRRESISHYRILEKLGSGSMGVVYKAEDTKLKRTVALKFLPPDLARDPEAIEQFIQEAQAVSALDHLNICTIHEVDETEDGQMFIAMAYYDGQTVMEKIEQRSLRIDEALDIAVQVAEGLQEAHERGIIHRDIKPANLMVTLRGEVKIVDFGLAKLAGEMKLTRAGTTLKAAAYKSPQQAKGEVVDHRTDIWSLGVVLYEMLTRALPFKGENERVLVDSILKEKPQSVMRLCDGAPAELDRLVDKMLAKRPEERYQTASDLLVDLREVKKRLESPAAAEKESDGLRPSIAVLPFTDLSAERDQEYFCDGLAEEIINALTHVEDLRVVARTSAFAFKGKCEDIREIGRRLNVGTLLEGSVRKAGSRLRISAQLVSVEDGYHLWSERYDRDLEDVFAIQDEISLAIVDKLKGKLFGKEKTQLLKRHTENPEAYTLYLKGRYFWNQRTEESVKRSIDYFQRAIEKDPAYALAYAGLADSFCTVPDISSYPQKEAYPKARQAVNKAIEIDDGLAEAHTSLAMVKLLVEGDWEGTEQELKRAIELNPAYVTAHHFYGYYLMSMARFDEAILKMRYALELDPLSAAINRNVGQVLYQARKYDQAIEQLRKTQEIAPHFSYVHLLLGLCYGETSKYKEALAELKEEKTFSGSWNFNFESWFAKIYVAMGRKEEAQKLLSEFLKPSNRSQVSPCAVAIIHFALGENDQGFEWLNKAYDERDRWLKDLKMDHSFDSVRSDPRFIKLLKKMGLEK